MGLATSRRCFKVGISFVSRVVISKVRDCICYIHIHYADYFLAVSVSFPGTSSNVSGYVRQLLVCICASNASTVAWYMANGESRTARIRRIHRRPMAIFVRVTCLRAVVCDLHDCDSYNACDVGTLPNQTNPDKQSPAAALHTDWGRSKYNFELSWLPGQRLSYVASWVRR
jgi:hypothetical protein